MTTSLHPPIYAERRRLVSDAGRCLANCISKHPLLVKGSLLVPMHLPHSRGGRGASFLRLQVPRSSEIPARSLVLQGFSVNALNPKNCTVLLGATATIRCSDRRTGIFSGSHFWWCVRCSWFSEEQCLRTHGWQAGTFCEVVFASARRRVRGWRHSCRFGGCGSLGSCVPQTSNWHTMTRCLLLWPESSSTPSRCSFEWATIQK